MASKGKQVIALSRASPEIRELLASAPLTSESDRAAYDAIIETIARDCEPADVMDWIWVKDVADSIYEGQKLRRVRAVIMTGDAGPEGDERKDARTRRKELLTKAENIVAQRLGVKGAENEETLVDEEYRRLLEEDKLHPGGNSTSKIMLQPPNPAERALHFVEVSGDLNVVSRLILDADRRRDESMGLLEARKLARRLR